MTRVHLRYSVVAADTAGGIGQRARTDKALVSLKRSLQKLKKITVESFDEHHFSGLYTTKYQLSKYVVDDIQRFTVVSVLYGSLYKRFHVYIKQGFKQTLHKRQTKIMETVHVTVRSSEMELLQRKKVDDGELRRSDERMARMVTIWPCVVRGSLTLTTYYMERARDEGVCLSPTASCAPRLVGSF